MIVIEGCNGEWAQKCYLPFLLGEASKGNLELQAVDIEPQIRPIARNATLWESARSKGQALYLDKKTDKASYEKLTNASHVFIVAPPRYHCDVAGFWLERLLPDGKIFIEKPLDVSVGAGFRLCKIIDEKQNKEAVFAFDHYIAKAYPFLQHKNVYLGEIGGVEKILFHFLESKKIPRKRVDTLDEGMIIDLFSHVLALVCATLGVNTTCSASESRAVSIKNVRAARYAGCRISGDTFAHIEFTVNSNIEVSSTVGMCVGNRQDKFMKLSGPNGKIHLDLVKEQFSVLNLQEEHRKKGRLNAEHVKSFLEGILQGNKPLSVPGVLSFDNAFGILEVLDKARAQIDMMPEYQCGESVGQILERFLKNDPS